jgi:hypothetical protein
MTFSRILNGSPSSSVKLTNKRVLNTKTGEVALIKTGLKAPITVSKESGSSNISFSASGSNVRVSVTTAVGDGVSISALVKAIQADGSFVGIPVTLEGYAVNPLGTLSLSSSSILEGSSANTVIGTIQNRSFGSTISIVDTLENRFAIIGNTVVCGTTPLNYEVAASHDITIRETLEGSSNSPNDSVITITVNNVFENPQLQVLTLSNNTIIETVASGTTVGTFTNKTAGSTLSLVNSAGGLFAISGNNVITNGTFDFETTTSYVIVVRETLGDSVNSPKDTQLTINILNVFENPSLSSLTLSASSIQQNLPYTINILGATPGSTLTGTVPTGMTLNSAARTISGTPTTPNSYNFALVETLGDSANSPRTSNVSITVTAAPTLKVLSLTNSSVLENSATGELVGVITNRTPGSTLSLTNTGGNRFAISGDNLLVGTVSINYEEQTSYDITIRETLAGSTNNPRDTVITIAVTNINEQPSLGNLTLSSSVATKDSFNSIDILGTTAGSVITGAVPTGMTLNSAARTISGTPTVSNTYNFTLTETLGDSPNSGRTSNVSIVVGGSAPAGYMLLRGQTAPGVYTQLQGKDSSGTYVELIGKE